MSIRQWNDDFTDSKGKPTGEKYRWLLPEDGGVPVPSVTTILDIVTEKYLKVYFKVMPVKMQEMKLTKACNRGDEVHDLVYQA